MMLNWEPVVASINSVREMGFGIWQLLGVLMLMASVNFFQALGGCAALLGHVEENV